MLIVISPFVLCGAFPPNSDLLFVLIGVLTFGAGIGSVMCARRLAAHFSEQAVLMAVGLYAVLGAILTISSGEIASCVAILIAAFILMLIWAYRAARALNRL
jgi:hypothetical protein